jgi:hypothetical protein
VREVWRIDLLERHAHVSTPDGELEVPTTDHLTWHPPGIAEPVTISIESLFAGTHPGASM